MWDEEEEAGTITAFAGSMRFVYLHAGVIALWMLVFEKSPWPTLTLIVSLEAIFLSTFVNDRAEPAGVLPTGQSRPRLRRERAGTAYEHRVDQLVHQLTTEIHARLVPTSDGTTATTGH